MLNKPILFRTASEPTNTLGLGTMTGFEDWRIKTEKNMIPKFTGTYRVDNYLSSQIQNDRVIMADASEYRLNQLFKIDKLTPKTDDKGAQTIDIEAHHIVGELIKNSIIDDIFLVNASPKKLWDALIKDLSAKDFEKFHFHTDIVSVANISINWKSVSTLQDVLFGDSSSSSTTDSFTRLWNGEWYFDNYDIYFLEKIGNAKKVLITYGQNLKTLSQEESIQNTYTAVQGYSSKKEKQAEESAGTITVVTVTDNGVTHAVNGDWGPAIRNAAKIMSVEVTDDYVNKIKNMIQGESNGSETIVNDWDSNAQAGHPSAGLLQFVEGTFQTYMVKPYTTWKRGFDQLCALFNMDDWKHQVDMWQVYHSWSPHGGKRMNEVKPTGPLDWDWPFPKVGEGKFMDAQLFGTHKGNGRTNDFHDGLDFGSIDHPGSEVHAIHRGTVTRIGNDAPIGWYLVTHSDDGYDIVYQEAFSAKSNIRVKEGQKIKTGDVVGIRDTSHVHIGVTKKSWLEGYTQGHSFDSKWGWLDPLKLIKEGRNKTVTVTEKEIGDPCNIFVQYLGSGRVALYSAPDGKTSDQYIKPGQHIKIIRQYNNGTQWYKTTDNNWINGKFINVNNGNNFLFNAIKGKGHINWEDKKHVYSFEMFNRTVRTKYLYSKVPIHLYPDIDSPIESYLEPNEDTNVMYRTQDDNGNDWYGLSDKQWINSQNIVIDYYTYQLSTGMGTVQEDTNAYAEPTSTRDAINRITKDSQCKVFMIAKNQGNTWVNIGGNQWINSQSVKFNLQPTAITENVNTRDIPPYYVDKVTVYDSPTWNRKTNGKYLTKGSVANITGQANSDNQAWYRVDQGWINGKYVDFSSSEDTAPYDPNFKSVPNDKSDTITLSEVYIEAPNANRFENKKILKKDFSEFNVDSADKLRGLVQSYIYDNRVGEIEVNLTVEFYQMTDELASLRTVDVGYPATVFFKEMNINETTEVTSMEWNGPKRRIENVHLGKKPETLRDTMNQFLAVADANSQEKATSSATTIEKSNNENLNQLKDDLTTKFDNLKIDWQSYKDNALTKDDMDSLSQKIQADLEKVIEEKFKELEKDHTNESTNSPSGSGSK